jgi:mRNA-degrading endonuclease RelE of RelBE toxin-antitoxin system
MKIRISKEFEKTARKLSGKYKESLKKMILEIKSAQSVEEISDCKKLVGYDSIYRVRMGDYRAFFFLEIKDNTAFLKYLVSRGEAYNKAYQNRFKKDDRL